MKLFSSSPLEDLQKISLGIETIQKQCIDLRIDHDRMKRDIKTILKGVAMIYSAPNEESEDSPISEDIPELEDK